MIFISKKRKKQIEDIANQKLMENGINPRFDLIKFLIEKEGFKIVLKDMNQDTTGLVRISPQKNTDNEKIPKLIAANTKLLNQPNFPQRLRFIVAHEYGHSLIHCNGERLFAHRSSSKKWTRDEKEADYFARCLLMPREEMEKMLFEDFICIDDEDYKIKHIAQFFNVTEKKAKMRIQEIGGYSAYIRRKEKEMTSNV